MNSNDVAPKPKNLRLYRIETVSRIVRFVILGFLVCTIGFLLLLPLWSAKAWSETSFERLGLQVVVDVLLCVWYWKLAGLFHFYERGLIFASETIQRIKLLGVLCVINWLLLTCRHLLLPAPAMLPAIPASPHVTVGPPFQVLSLGFFSFSIYGINLGLLLAGLIIVIIAWIMDEGRKIQEEQELTV
jgi:hypothetical protein